MSATDYNQLQLVAFRLAAEEYAVPVQNVEGIIKLTEPTLVPGAPYFIRGVINLRGKVISIFDLRRRFSMAPLDDESDARVLVVHHDGKNVGVLVDAVSEVLTLDGDAPQPPPAEVGAGESRTIEGICKVEDRLIIILDLGAVLADDGADVVAPTSDQVRSAAADAPVAQPAAVAAAEELVSATPEPALAAAD